ncbi:MAG TPA: hypothetical protein VND64_13235 [Pirellulales bacterium]|nr:hypothetical protein [Pirellulales bacterium]
MQPTEPCQAAGEIGEGPSEASTPLPYSRRRGMLVGMVKPLAKIVSLQTNNRRCA